VTRTYQGHPCKRGHAGIRYENNGYCIECSRNARKRYASSDSSNWYAENRVKAMFYDARRRAEEKGIAFTIILLDLERAWKKANDAEVCPYLGIPFDFNTAGPDGSGRCAGSPSLDRIDSSLGYEPGNIEIVSYRTNSLKGDGTADEHARIARRMHLHLRKRAA
jgi:hypothetical protein